MDVIQHDILDNPSKDGWTEEHFVTLANQQLKKLAQQLSTAAEIDSRLLNQLTTVDFSCGALRPESLETVFHDESLTVKRPTSESLPTRSKKGDGGQARFPEALREFKQPIPDFVARKCDFKITRIEPLATGYSTRVLFSFSGNNTDSVVEQNGELVVDWRLSANADPPKILKIRMEQFEQVRMAGKGGTLFADCTESVLGRNRCYREQLLLGFNYWLNRGQDKRYWSILGNPGLAIGDVNGDGLEDVYLCQEQGLPNRLFVQNEDGTVQETSAEAGVDWLENSRGVLLVDFDNDGDQDLAVGIVGSVVLASNDGHGKFSVRTVLDTDDDVMSLSAADYDQDGRVDLYVCVYRPDAQPDKPFLNAVAGAVNSFVFYDANGGGQNSLWRNEIRNPGEWQFVDRTSQSGLAINNERFSLAASWDDFDNDGDLDLYVGNDFGRNNLYRNTGANFQDIASASEVEDQAFGMSVSWADYDRDGWMDAYISNMYSTAGNRITRLAQFKPDLSQEMRAKYQHLARGNTLFRNNGNGTFDDRAMLAGVDLGRWAWSSVFADVNNDGWEDLLVTNGFITTEDTSDL